MKIPSPLKSCFILLTSMVLLASCGGSSTSENESSGSSTDSTSSTPTPTPQGDDIFYSLRVCSDDTGIYSVTFQLNDNAADKATIEMLYTGAKGSAEEGSIVNRYRVEYYLDTTEKFEIATYYNGAIDRYLHQQSTVKITNTFGAATRAADVTINYTPDGEQAKQVFTAEADGKVTNYR